jgi:Trk-type K+ transport systems, membrane components
MNKGLIFYLLGRITAVASGLFVFPIIVSVIYADGCFFDFLIPAAAMFLCGAAVSLKKPKTRISYAREGFVIVTLMWVILSLFGSVPYIMSGAIPSFIDAFFETVSGFSTTGVTTLADVEILPKSLLFWRSFTNWAGGMGVLALAIAILPAEEAKEKAKNSSVYILKAETPGPKFGKLVSKVHYNVRILYGIYIALTAIGVVLLCIGGMPVFDSIVNMFGTAGTGGFAIKNFSIAHYNSVYFEVVIGLFMLLFGINFNIYYFIIIGKVSKVFKSEELRWYLGIIGAAALAIAVNISHLTGSFLTSLRYAFFQVSSIITTTGYTSTDYDLWPTFSKTILFVLMFVGSCAGSTGGGIKISRVLIMVKTAIKEVRYMINPREVCTIKCDGEYVEQRTVIGVSSYMLAYIIIFVSSVVIVSLEGFDIASTVAAVVTCINNIGPELNKIGGAVQNFSEFSVLSKCVLTFNMLAGRLEIFPLLILFSPSIWKKG